VSARRSARILLFDTTGRVLLIRFVVPRAGSEFEFWLTPGGEIEPGEQPLEAAVRELEEELGLRVPVVGPDREEINVFEHQGEMRENVDYFFHARCEEGAPRLIGLTAEEILVMQEIRWWSAAEIAKSEERFFPVDLSARMVEVWSGLQS
jgi:8-oxo-dGTP diphosphatase